VTAVRPREVVHRGRQLAAGVVLDAGLLGERGARARALALWEPGVRVLAIDGGLLVRFPRPRPIAEAQAPGLVVVEDGGVLAAAPLSRAERAALSPDPGALVLALGGEARAVVPGPELDPSEWLGLEPALVAVEPLGGPPPPPPAPPLPASPDVRKTLHMSPESARAAEAAAAIRLALARRASPDAKGRPRLSLRGVVAGAGAAFGIVRFSAGWLRDALGKLARALAPLERPGAPVRAYLPPLPSRPGPLRRALSKALTLLLLASRVARLAGLWQGAYVLRLVRMFERGDLGEALRHAIPLGGLDADAAPSLGVPDPRAALRIDPARSPGAAMVGLHPGVRGALQQLYRGAFARLEAQGRFEEAAFVLAELLRADAEAVSFLERHGQLRLAAELAEARELPAGLVVRQWFLAGERERAVRIARTRQAFADAVDRLERSQRRDEAAALRLCWAEDLAEAGDLEGAVGAARTVPEARAVIARWIELAVASRSDAGRALLPAWLELDPARFPEVRDRVLADCADESEDGVAHRSAIARGLARTKGVRGISVLARPLLRAALRDRARGRWPGADPVKELAALARDGALEADLPRVAARRTPRPEVKVTLQHDDRGARAALDAAALPGGRVLVAFGEAGAALLARDGREVARFDVPSHRLVVSDLGTRALALGDRGEATRVSVLDLDARTARPLCDLRLEGFAPSYDGARWWVVVGRSVAMLDALRDDLRTLWHVRDLPGPPFALERDGGTTSFVTGFELREGWVYEGEVLRRRAPLAPALDGESVQLALGGYAGGAWHAVMTAAPDGPATLRSAEVGASGGLPLAPGEQLLGAGVAGGARVGVALRTAAGIDVVIVDPADLRPVARVSLPGAEDVVLRLAGERVTVADRWGRVVGIDLAAGRVTHDVRT